MNASPPTRAMNSSPAWKLRRRARRAGSQAGRAAHPPPSSGGPRTWCAVPDEAGESLVKLIEVLDDHDDVQNVYGNYELSDALMAKLSG